MVIFHCGTRPASSICRARSHEAALTAIFHYGMSLRLPNLMAVSMKAPSTKTFQCGISLLPRTCNNGCLLTATPTRICSTTAPSTRIYVRGQISLPMVRLLRSLTIRHAPFKKLPRRIGGVPFVLLTALLFPTM